MQASGPDHQGPILVGCDQGGADALGISLDALTAATERVRPVATRSHDHARLYRVVEVLAVLDPARSVAMRLALMIGPPRDRLVRQLSESARPGREPVGRRRRSLGIALPPKPDRRSTPSSTRTS